MGLLIHGHAHGILPWLAHCDLTMAIPWNSKGDVSFKEVVEGGVVGERGVVDSMEVFHG